MAAPAGLRDVGMGHGRFGIGGGDGFMHVAVTIAAGGGGVAGSGQLCVRAVAVGRSGIGVTLRAGDLLRRRFVREALDVGVTVDAGKHGAVDGVLHLCRIDEKTARLAVHVLTERGVAVTREAVFVLELVLGRERSGYKRKAEDESSKQKKFTRVHGTTMRVLRGCCRDSNHRWPSL